MRSIVLLMSVIACTQSTLAQVTALVPEDLERVDSRVADVSVLATSLRDLTPGLGMPAGFDMVYRVPGSPNLLMRGNGALFGVFEQSVYTPYRGMSIAEVPPSTVFHIGIPHDGLSVAPESQAQSRLEEAESEASVESQDDYARAGYGIVIPVGYQAGSRQEYITDDQTEIILPRFVADRSYRSQRLAEMLTRRLEIENDQSP